jgi:hypothetical protein
MDQQNYNACIAVTINPREAFEGISHVSEWWATNFEGSAKNLNDVFTVRFGETFVTFKIVEMVADKKIVWQVIDCHLFWLNDKSEWKDTKIAWEISTKNNLTQISMTHVGLVPEIECYTDCQKGWNFYVKESLFKLLTERKGLPDTSKNSR